MTFKIVKTLTGGEEIPPENLNNGNSEPEKKTRKPRESKKQSNRADLANYIAVAHAAANRLTDSDFFETTEDENQKLAKALQDVFDLYDFPVSPAMLAWGNLFATSAVIYGPKLYLLAQLKKQSAEVRQNFETADHSENSNFATMTADELRNDEKINQGFDRDNFFKVADL